MPAKKKTVTPQDTAIFCSQTAMVLQSGIPLHDGISAICEKTGNKASDEVFGIIETKIKETGSLYLTLKETGVFPSYMVNMVNIGERSGKLEETMRSLAEYYEREAALKKSIRSAIIYPAVLIVMIAIIIGVLVLRVLPVFNQVFDTLGTEIPSGSASVLELGTAIAKWALVLVLITAVTAIILYIYSRTAKGSSWLARFTGKFPLTKKLSIKISSGRFASVIAMLLQSGYDIEAALDIIPGILSNQFVLECVEQCKSLMKEGKSFSQSLTEIGLFTGVYAKLINIGFQTGHGDSAMQKVADMYSDEVDASVNSMVSAIEPAMVAVLSIIVGIILLSVMLPLMSIMSSIG